ncbi:MAG: glycosyl transferase [Muribaculum sp.]|nr:glycosyl transferase [Muribaculum sp.]
MLYINQHNKQNTVKKTLNCLMIPKIIHYCWFGGNQLPKDALKCIDSWKKFLPDYKIIEWNESNFDVHQCGYSSEAYKMKKFAFVSDYARFKILNKYGGLYFDTDVELISSPLRIISDGPFMGIEKSSGNNSEHVGVAPGLGLGLESGMPIIEEIVNYYESTPFIFGDHTVVTVMTNILCKYGYIPKDVLQKIKGITIYPSEFLCPMDSTTGMVSITSNTVSIHHYSASWLNHNNMSYRLHILKNNLIKIFGRKIIINVCNLIKGR